MKLIVGLGNPGKEYINTRHNIGFMVIDHFVNNSNWQEKWKALYTEMMINNEKVLLVKPKTYMNLSGNALIEFVNFYKINLEDILVIHDDLDLNIGTYRLKINSSSGGHNGIKSLIERLGSTNFARLKVGISSNKEMDPKDYVLGRFTQEELETLAKLYPTFNEIITSFITDGIDKTMNKYNKRSISHDQSIN